MSIGLGMDISIRGEGEALSNKEAAGSNVGNGGPEENGWGGVSTSSLNLGGTDLEKQTDANGGHHEDMIKSDANNDDIKEPLEDDILSQTEIKHVEEVLIDPVDDVVVEECCPEVCYRVCPCCIGDPDSPFWQLWYRHRLQVSRYSVIIRV